MSRVLFNDAKISERVASDFIPVSGGIERWQPGRYGHGPSEAADWFQKMAQRAYQGNEFLEAWFKGMQTYQGMYVAGPDGSSYGHTNTLLYGDLTPEKFIAFLDRAREDYAKRPPKKTEVSKTSIARAAPPSADPATSVIRVFSRDRTAGGRPPYFGPDHLGRDHMWIFADEVREMLRTGGAAGTPVPLPSKVMARLVRFQLLDNVGQAFGEEDVRRADFDMKIVRQSDKTRTLAFTGAYASERVGSEGEEKGKKFGVEGRIEGEMNIDTDKSKIVRFRAYGEAQAWGHHGKEAKYPLVFAFIEANDAVAQTVPPVWHDISPIWTPIYTDPKMNVRKP